MTTELDNLSNNFNSLINEYQSTYHKYIDSINSGNKTDAMNYSYELQNLNAQLMDINKQISDNSNNSYSKFQDSQNQSYQQQETINNNYQSLLEERIQIEKMIREYETLNRAYENGNINVTSNYYSYIALLFITILLVFLLLKYSFTGSQSGGGNNFGYLHNVYKFLPIILALFAIIYFIKKNKLETEYY